MNDYGKLYDTLIERAGGESECKRFQERVELGGGGIHARLFTCPHPEENEHGDDNFGHSVVIRDLSKSGLGLLSQDEIVLDGGCHLHVVDMQPLKGTLIYRKEEEDGKIRYGFSLDEWLSEETHQKLSI